MIKNYSTYLHSLTWQENIRTLTLHPSSQNEFSITSNRDQGALPTGQQWASLILRRLHRGQVGVHSTSGLFRSTQATRYAKDGTAALWESCARRFSQETQCELTSLLPPLAPPMIPKWIAIGKYLNPEPCGPQRTKDCPSLVHIGVLLTPPVDPTTAASGLHPLPHRTGLRSAESFRVHVVKVKQTQC